MKTLALIDAFAMNRHLPMFDLETFMPYRLAVVAKQVSRSLAQRYRAEFGLTMPEWRILAHLSQANAISVRDLHEHVDLDKSQVSRAATKLEEAGYVSKDRSKTDKRLIELSLTQKGQNLMGDLVPLAKRHAAELTAPLTAEEKAVLDRALEIISEKAR